MAAELEVTVSPQHHPGERGPSSRTGLGACFVLGENCSLISAFLIFRAPQPNPRHKLCWTITNTEMKGANLPPVKGTAHPSVVSHILQEQEATLKLLLNRLIEARSPHLNSAPCKLLVRFSALLALPRSHGHGEPPGAGWCCWGRWSPMSPPS